MKIYAQHCTDFYKTGHIYQYPKGTTRVYSNSTPRGDKNASMLPGFDHKVVHLGTSGICQWLLRDFWKETFFDRPKAEVVDRYKRRMDGSLGTGAVGTEHIAALHDVGFLPIHLKALPEGSRVPIRVPVLTAQNTIDEFYWLTNYIETQTASETWGVLSDATIAQEFRSLLDAYAAETGGDPAFVDWQAHDFSGRGMRGIHDAAQSAIGHLLSFKGTDTISALDYIDEYYPGSWEQIGGSIPATEHSVMCAGEKLCEKDTFRSLLNLYPSGPVSIVSDTWDFWNVLTVIAAELKTEIMARDGKLVFRPDSGDPVKIIVGDPDAPVGSPAYKGAVECLWEIFGGTRTSKGYKLLDSHVGLIYGDSITLSRALAILEGLRLKGFCSTNIVFGVGSFTYVYMTRDTFGNAIKSTWAIVNGELRELFKDPVTDSGLKRSAKGLLRVEWENNDYVLYDQQTVEQERQGAFATVFLDGQVKGTPSFSHMRQRLRNQARVYSIPALVAA